MTPDAAFEIAFEALQRAMIVADQEEVAEYLVRVSEQARFLAESIHAVKECNHP